jgi:hypothetical protein
VVNAGGQVEIDLPDGSTLVASLGATFKETGDGEFEVSGHRTISPDSNRGAAPRRGSSRGSGRHSRHYANRSSGRLSQSAQQSQQNGDALLGNDADKRVIRHGIADASSEVSFQREFNNQNVTVGSLIKGESGNLSITETSQNVARGLESNDGGLFGLTFAGDQVKIQNATAITIALPQHSRINSTMGQTGRFNTLSAGNSGAPIFVKSPYDGKVVMFESGYTPRQMNLR